MEDFQREARHFLWSSLLKLKKWDLTFLGPTRGDHFPDGNDRKKHNDTSNGLTGNLWNVGINEHGASCRYHLVRLCDLMLWRDGTTRRQGTADREGRSAIE